ncbi:MAG: metal ABC transporter permease, partial [Anaerolineae bacterium]
MVDLVTGPLGYSFMVRGLVAVVLVGVVCGTVGTFVVLRGMAFFSDALAHAVLPGIAVGYLASGGSSGPLFWWGLATAVATAFVVAATARGTRLKEDTAVGIVFAGMFALGIAIMSVKGGFAVDITHLLFGNVLGVSEADLLRTAVLAAIVIATVAL